MRLRLGIRLRKKQWMFALPMLRIQLKWCLCVCALKTWIPMCSFLLLQFPSALPSGFIRQRQRVLKGLSRPRFIRGRPWRRWRHLTLSVIFFRSMKVSPRYHWYWIYLKILILIIRLFSRKPGNTLLVLPTPWCRRHSHFTILHL